MIRTMAGKSKIMAIVNRNLSWLNYREMFRDYVSGQMFQEWRYKHSWRDFEGARRCRDNVKEASRLYIMLSSKESGLDKETLQYDILGALRLADIEKRGYLERG